MRTRSQRYPPLGERRIKMNRWSMFLKRTIVSQTKIETVSNATLGKRLKDEMERIVTGFSERIVTILN